MSDPDGEDAARALAVLDRLFAHDPQAQVEMRRNNDGMVTVRVPRAGMMSSGLWPSGIGDSPAAALLALGARLGEDE